MYLGKIHSIADLRFEEPIVMQLMSQDSNSKMQSYFLQIQMQENLI
jgi:hypothetical protein